jgi:hypothetical protein
MEPLLEHGGDPTVDKITKSCSVIGPVSIILVSLGLPIAFFAVVIATYYDSSSGYPGYFRYVGAAHIGVVSICGLCVTFSLLCAALSDPGSSERILNDENLRASFPFLTESFLESLPKCEKCGLPKPERCHHCSICNKCHCKMDHHCPAVGNCVALRNFRSFLAMLLWGVIGSGLQGFFCLAEAILDEYNRASRVITIGFVLISAVLAFWLWCFFGEQMARASRNQTTLEQIGRYELKYDLGALENFRQVFGNRACRFFNPFPTNELSGFEWSLPDYWRPENRDTTA